MNNKIIIAGIALLIFLGGGYIFLKAQPSSPTSKTSSSPSAPTTNTPSSAPTSTSVAPNEQATITLMEAGFTPKVLTVKAGTTVTWINKSGSVATVNSNPHPTHLDYPPLNLGRFFDGGTLSLRFDSPGTYGYHNHLDPEANTGTIIVTP